MSNWFDEQADLEANLSPRLLAERTGKPHGSPQASASTSSVEERKAALIRQAEEEWRISQGLVK